MQCIIMEKHSNQITTTKPTLYWTYIIKGTVYPCIKVNRCIAKTLHTYAYMQLSLILLFPIFYVVTLAVLLQHLLASMIRI